MNTTAAGSAKAIAAAVIAGLTSFVVTIQGRTDVDTMRALDWVIVLASTLIAGLTVWAIPNKEQPPNPPDQLDDQGGAPPPL